MEKVSAVLVHFDARLGVDLAVGVSANMRAVVDHGHLCTVFACGAVCERKAEKAGSDDEKVGCAHAVSFPSRSDTSIPQ